jgi:hypothetical protein
MTVLDIGAIRAALAAQCATLPGLWAYDYPADDLHLGPSGAAVITDAELDDFVAYHRVGGSNDVRVLFEVQIVVAATSEPEANRLLDAYRGVGTERSVVTCLESTGNLSGLADYVLVTGVGPVRVHPQAGDGVRFWTATFSVEVWAV